MPYTKLDYKNVLNQAQYDAVTSREKSVLVVAGAGSGKTRVIVYRLAWLMEHGVAPSSILLLTFTRKAAREMMTRVDALRGEPPGALTGGTFHSFAFGVLRRFKPEWLENRPFSLMDSADITEGIRQCKNILKIAKHDTSFPKAQTIAALLSKARNKEKSITEILQRESFHLLPHAEALEEIAKAYAQYRREKGLMDYDDLLFELESLLVANDYAARELRATYGHILVDEYQDTNLVQARIVRLLAGSTEPGSHLSANVMAVGDEAQSIYAFRGANVRNILDFPKLFPDTRIIRLEENYRSKQPVLDVANDILAHAEESYRNKLYSRQQGGSLPRLIAPLSDSREADIVTSRIEELLATRQPKDIAVLFRSGFHSFPLENALRQKGIAYRKYGGIRFVEAAHIKDALSFARLVINPLDFPAFSRIAAMHKGIGPKTTQRLFETIRKGDEKAIKQALKKFTAFHDDLKMIVKLREYEFQPCIFFEQFLAYYRPRLKSLYPDDWPSRKQELEALGNLAETYADLQIFVADMSLESPEDDDKSDSEITLSTIHSAKGLEWDAVLMLDMVEDRFPSRHAQAHPEDYEEERRLFYVGCTRAREILELYAPKSIYSRAVGGHEPVAQSPFVREISSKLLQKSNEAYEGCLVEEKQGDDCRPSIKRMRHKENNRSIIASKDMRAFNKSEEDKSLKDNPTEYCRHRIFGRGKIVEWIDQNKVKVKFSGYGEKIILAEYLLSGE